MRMRPLRLLAKLKRLPLVPRHLLWPILIPVLTCFPLLLAGSIIVATVLSVLKYYGLLPLYSWSGVVVASTSFFWYPVVVGYIAVAVAGVMRWYHRPRQGRRSSDAESGVAGDPDQATGPSSL
jgi:hypothetical protein